MVDLKKYYEIFILGIILGLVNVNPMPIAEKLLAQFQPEEFYHVICKCIDGKKLFNTDNNRLFFLKRYDDFLFDFVDTYAYFLLDNHVHWLIKTKRVETIGNVLQSNLKSTVTHKKYLNGECDFHELVEQQFNRFFISYSLAFNISLGIKGHLFSRPFKRIIVADNEHLTQLSIYIHANAEKHGICKDFTTYKWSSWLSMLSDKPTHLMRDEVLDWFGGKQRFFDTHKSQREYYYQHLISGE